MDDITSPRPPASGRFVLRIEPGVHAALRGAAEAAGLSLNAYCAARLALPGGVAGGPAGRAVERAMALLGEALVGVVGYGSWARGEMATRSDVDLLVVVEPSRPVERSLYRRWDEAPVDWEGHPVEPHFARLPAMGDPVSGLWAEAAVEGIILFERGFEVSRWLAEVRRRIAEGRLVRRRSHGQPYWVEAA